jgi:hypothetical protein
VFALPTAAQTLRYEGNAGLSNGTYTLATPTTTFAFSNGLALDIGALSVRVTVPAYLQNPLTIESALAADTAASVADGGGQAQRDSSTGGGQPAATPAMSASDPVGVADLTPAGRRLYVGDPVGQIGVRVMPSNGASLALRVSAKAPVTDSVNFGTGRWDVGFGMSLSQRLGGMTFAAVDVSYWLMGDPVGLALQNPVVASASVSGLFGGRWGWIASATGGQSTVEGFPAFYSVGGGLALLGQVMTLNVNAMVGLSETAADFAVGIGWSLRLVGR